MINLRPERLFEAARAAARRDYDVANAHVLMTKAGGTTELSYSLAGRLFLSASGWLLLSVPNAIVRGAFDALHEPGVELPYQTDGRLNAHVSVMRPEELEAIGGVAKVTEKGHTFRYTLGPLRSVEPAGWKEMSRVWFIEVNSPELEKLRKSYGLSALPNEGKYKFHITVAVRRKNVLKANDIAKAAAEDSPYGENCPTCGGPAVARCRCPIGCRACAAGHQWHRCPVHGRVNPGSGHGSGGGCTCGEKAAAEALPGGEGDGMPDRAFDAEELADGVREEKEHTGDPALAKEIAKDHLAGTPDYYTRLEEAGVEGGGVEVRKSAVDGLGLFAKRAFRAGSVVVSRALTKHAGLFGLTRYEESDPARYTNHADEPNVELRKEADGSVSFVALRDIGPNEEVFADYRKVGDALGPGFYFTYGGQPYHGESTSGAPPYDGLSKQASAVLPPAGLAGGEGLAPAFEKAALVDQYGGLTGAMRYLLLDPLVQSWAAGHGLVYAPGEGDILGRLDTMRRMGEHWRASSGAVPGDKPTYERFLGGLSRLAGGDPDTNPAMRQAIGRAADDIGFISPYIRVVAPDLWERMHGWRGSAQTLASKLYQNAQKVRNPLTGRTGSKPDVVSGRAQAIFNRLYGNGALQSLTAGFSAGQLGDIDAAAQARGLHSSPTQPTPAQHADQLAATARPVAAVRDLLATQSGPVKAGMVGTMHDGERAYPACPSCHQELKGSDVYTDKKGWQFCRRCFRKGKGLLKKGLDAAQNVDLLEKLTHGQLPNMDPQEVALQVRRLQALAGSTPGGLPRLMQLLGHGGDVAEAAGLQRHFATQTAPGAAAFGRAFGSVAGRQGFGGLTMDDATDLDQRLRASAAASPLANLMAATIALDDAGLVAPGSPAAEMAAAARDGQTVTASGVNLGRLTPPRWVELMGSSGVSTGTAWEQYRAREANQEYVMRHNLGDAVRHAQGDVEVKPVLQNFLARGALPALANARIVGREQAELAGPLSETMTRVLTGLPHQALVGDRASLVRAVASQVGQAHPDVARRLGPRGLAELAHTALGNVDQTVRSDPRFRPYRNMVGLLTAHRPDVLQAGAAAQADVDVEARMRDRFAHVGQQDWLQRLSDTVQTADRQTPLTGMVARGFGAVPQRELTPPPPPPVPAPLRSIAQHVEAGRQSRRQQLQPPPAFQPGLPLAGQKR